MSDFSPLLNSHFFTYSGPNASLAGFLNAITLSTMLCDAAVRHALTISQSSRSPT